MFPIDSKVLQGTCTLICGIILVLVALNFMMLREMNKTTKSNWFHEFFYVFITIVNIVLTTSHKSQGFFANFANFVYFGQFEALLDNLGQNWPFFFNKCIT